MRAPRGVTELGRRAGTRVAALVGRPLFWALFVGLLAGGPLVRAAVTAIPADLPTLASLPDFELTDQLGRRFGSAELRGRVWVANFIFTRCPTVCPTLTAAAGTIQHRARNLGDAFHIVSFSVDPGYDTPARLADYAARHRASPRMWRFLSGPPEAVKAAVEGGLKVSMGREGPPADFASIFHGTHFVLVDAALRIRGYYDPAAPDGIDRLMRDAGLLVNRGR